MNILDQPLLVLDQHSLNEYGPNVFLLGGQLALQPALGLLEALYVLVEPLVSAGVLEHDQLEDSGQGDEHLGVVGAVLQHLLQQLVHQIHQEGSRV